MKKDFDKIQKCVTCEKEFSVNNGKCKYTLVDYIGEDGKETESPGMWFCSDECNKIAIGDIIEMVQNPDEETN